MTREPVDGHVHRIKPAVAVLLGVCIVGLLAGIVLSYMQAQATERRLAVLEEYIEGRGQYRDAEADRLEARIAEGICDLLEQLPQTALLDEVRGKYGCGPGRPVEEFPPQVRQELSGQAAPPSPTPRRPPPAVETADPAPEQPSELRRGGDPLPPRTGPSPTTPPPAPVAPASPSPSPERQPLIDLQPLTDPLLCQGLGICI